MSEGPVKITADVVEVGLNQVNATCAALSADHALMLAAYAELHGDLVALGAYLNLLVTAVTATNTKLDSINALIGTTNTKLTNIDAKVATTNTKLNGGLPAALVGGKLSVTGLL